MKVGHRKQSWKKFVKQHVNVGLDAEMFQMILNMDIGVRYVVENTMIKL